MKLSIATDFPAIARRLEQLRADVAGPALASALNRTIAEARTQMTRRIAAEYAVAAGYVRERLAVEYASARKGQLRLVAVLRGGQGRRRSANVIRFIERATTLAQGRKRKRQGMQDRLYVRIRRGGAAKPLPRGAFIGNRGRTIFMREGPGRLPIKPIQTIDVAQMFNAQRINEAVVRHMLQRFPAIFERDVGYFISKHAPRG